MLPVSYNVSSISHKKLTAEVESETAARKLGEPYREIQRGEEDGRLQQSQDEEREGESRDAATGCTRDSLPKGVVY